MRNFSSLLILGGIVGFLYCQHQLSTLEPVPEGLSISRSMQYPAGKMEMGRAAAAGAAVFGLLMLMARR